MARPDFFIAGFYKCGTTSLYCILQQHKNILVSDEKENFFFADKELYKKGIAWYEKTYYDFEKKDSKDKIIEVNPGLSEVHGTAKRLSHFYDSNTPIVFIVRNPVDFVYSNFKFLMRRGVYSLKQMNYCKQNTFSVAFEHYVKDSSAEIKMYKHFFSSQIMEYKKYFKSIKIIFLEDMFQDAERTYQEILNFWGLEYEQVDVSKKANVTDFMPQYPLLKKMHLKVRNYNQKNLLKRESNLKKSMLRATRILEDKMFDYIMETRLEDKSQISEQTRRRLERFFDSEKKSIEDITGRNLQDIWW